MKYSFLLLVLVSAQAFSQKIVTQPFEGAIVVIPSVSNMVAMFEMPLSKLKQELKPMYGESYINDNCDNFIITTKIRSQGIIKNSEYTQYMWQSDEGFQTSMFTEILKELEGKFLMNWDGHDVYVVNVNGTSYNFHIRRETKMETCTIRLTPIRK